MYHPMGHRMVLTSELSLRVSALVVRVLFQVSGYLARGLTIDFLVSVSRLLSIGLKSLLGPHCPLFAALVVPNGQLVLPSDVQPECASVALGVDSNVFVVLLR